jgi:hypothetical protein
MTSHAAGRFAAIFATLFAAHQAGDYWVQTHRQAAYKGLPGWPGRRACLGHVASYTLACTGAVLGADRALGLRVRWPGLLAGQLLSAATHYIADRRAPLRALALAIDPNKREYLDNGGAAGLDQSYHLVWLAVAALLTTALSHE